MTEVVSGVDGAVEEVRRCFEAYEQALSAGDAAATDAWFLDGHDTVRFGVADEQWGTEQIRRWRRQAPPVPPGRFLTSTAVTPLTPDAVVVTTLFGYPDTTDLGRQSQTWVRTPAGWRIAHAHVSTRPVAG